MGFGLEALFYCLSSLPTHIFLLNVDSPSGFSSSRKPSLILPVGKGVLHVPLSSFTMLLSQPRVHSVYHREIAQVELVVKNLLANSGDARAVGSVPGEGNGNPLQYACHGQRSLAGYTL